MLEFALGHGWIANAVSCLGGPTLFLMSFSLSPNRMVRIHLATVLAEPATSGANHSKVRGGPLPCVVAA